MPFKSEKQRKFMHANHPEIAERWEHEGRMKNKPMPMKGGKMPMKSMPKGMKGK